MKPVAYVNEDTIGEIFSTATEIWKWFNMSTIPISGEPVNDTFHYKVDYPYLKNTRISKKYVRNYFSTEIAINCFPTAPTIPISTDIFA